MAVIKRYANRKLYDTDAGRYITLEEIGQAIRRGEEVQVIDHETGADLTAVTLVQVIFDREKKIGGMLPKAILTSLIQTGEVAIQSIRGGISSILENNQQVEQEIKRRLQVLLDDGLLAMDEFTRLTELLLAPRFRTKARTETVQIKVDDPDAADPQELDRLNQQIADLEREIQNLQTQKPI